MYIDKISNIYRTDNMKMYENNGKYSRNATKIKYLLKYLCCVPIYIVIRLLRKLIRGEDYSDKCFYCAIRIEGDFVWRLNVQMS